MNARTRQRGLSLVEVMIALALGAFVTAGIVQLFTANQQTWQTSQGQARLQENARFAMDFLADAARMAGYSGCSARLPTRNLVRDEGGQTPELFDMDDAVSGHTGLGEDHSPGLGAWLAGQAPDPGSDVLVLKSALGDGISFQAQQPDAAASAFVDRPSDCGSNRCPGFEDGTVLLASDCRKATVFMLTHHNPQSNPDRLLLVFNTGVTVNGLGNSSQRLADGDQEFLDDASLYSLRNEAFFIAPGAGVNNRGDTPPALWRKRGQQAAVELVEGIERLQVRYGEDTSGDGIPNRYRPIHLVGDRSAIVSLRLKVTATSVDVVTDEGDGLLRREFSQTIALRNRIRGG